MCLMFVQKVVDCLVGRSAPWALVGTCNVVSHMAYREPSVHYFTCLHLFGIGEVASDGVDRCPIDCIDCVV